MKISTQRYTWIFWFSFLIVLFLNLLIWLYVNQVEKTFEEELKRRLMSISRMMERLIDENRFHLLIPGEQNNLAYLHFQNLIESIRRENDLQSFILFSPDGAILVSAPELIALQGRSSLSATDYFAQTRSGLYQVSDIETHEGEPFMSAYGPVLDTDGFVIGVHVIEARATYFDVLDNLKNRLFIFSLLNFVLILLIAAGLYRAIRRTIRYETEIKDREHLVQLGQMAATVAHEIRNPLGIIEGTSDVIRKKFGNADDEIFTFIPKEVERLRILIGNFLRFARTPDIQVSAFKLSDLFKRVQTGCTPEESNRTAFQSDPEWILQTDENLLEQALLNIIRNALQATTAKGAVTITGHVSSRGKCTISVTDTGSGIKNMDLDKIFNPFYTTRQSGTGLGLAISRRLIRQLGGTITVTSVENTGTKCIIDIPARYRKMD